MFFPADFYILTFYRVTNKELITTKASNFTGTQKVMILARLININVKIKIIHIARFIMYKQRFKNKYMNLEKYNYFPRK